MHFKEARSLLSAKNGMNIYRGCTHGCIYCDSRSRCYGMEHEFEDIEVKINAPEKLEDALRRKRKKCVIGTGAMTDPYLPLENELRLTRRCVEIIDKYGFGLSIISKSAGLLRDLDLFKSINEKAKCVIQMTLTTFDEGLCRVLEPGVSTTKERFETLKILRREEIPTVVWLSPVLPYINDTEENLRGILDYCADAGVRGILCFGMGLTLRDGNREYFYSRLDERFPGMSDRYKRRYGNMYSCQSDKNAALMRILRSECARRGIMCDTAEVFRFINELDDEPPLQMSLF